MTPLKNHIVNPCFQTGLQANADINNKENVNRTNILRNHIPTLEKKTTNQQYAPKIINLEDCQERLKLFISKNDAVNASELSNQMLRSNLKFTEKTYSILIANNKKFNIINGDQQLLGRIEKDSAVLSEGLFSKLILQFSLANDGKSLLRVFAEMNRRRLSLSSQSIEHIINYCIRNGDIENAMAHFKDIAPCLPQALKNGTCIDCRKISYSTVCAMISYYFTLNPKLHDINVMLWKGTEPSSANFVTRNGVIHYLSQYCSQLKCSQTAEFGIIKISK